MVRIIRVTLPPQKGIIDAHACEGEEIGGIKAMRNEGISLLVNIIYVLKQIALMALKQIVKKVTK